MVMAVLKEPCQDRINFHKLITMILILITTVHTHLAHFFTLLLLYFVDRRTVSFNI